MIPSIGGAGHRGSAAVFNGSSDCLSILATEQHDPHTIRFRLSHSAPRYGSRSSARAFVTRNR